MQPGQQARAQREARLGRERIGARREVLPHEPRAQAVAAEVVAIDRLVDRLDAMRLRRQIDEQHLAVGPVESQSSHAAHACRIYAQQERVALDGDDRRHRGLEALGDERPAVGRRDAVAGLDALARGERRRDIAQQQRGLGRAVGRDAEQHEVGAAELAQAERPRGERAVGAARRRTA